jgi:D-arabinose 1-dehydrogenase-like Zn-dependent alcohol dehydrogenase
VAGDVKINSAQLLMKGLSVHGWPSGHALDSEEAIRFAQLHDVNCLVEEFPFAEVQKAFDHMKSGKARFRAVIKF